MAEVNIDVAKEESVQVVNTNVGTSSDTASSTPTTLFAGIKGLIAWFTGTWTAARAGYVDTINTNVSTVNTNVGTTANTGGTTTAGTVMAKLNALLTNMTSTRAGYIDTIKSLLENATYGLSALKTALTGGSVPVVKSVQKGTIPYLSSRSGYIKSVGGTMYYSYVDVALSYVNISKTICHAKYKIHYNRVSCELISSTILRVYFYSVSHTSDAQVLSDLLWEVVEFY